MPVPLRQIKNRIRAIENTRKVTAAMEMVSASKLSRVNKLLYASRAYVTKLEFILHELINSQEGLEHPLFENRQPSGRICLCLITSDTGLCSTYNNNVIRAAEEFLNVHDGKGVDLVCIGKKGFNHFKKQQRNILNSYLGLNGRYSQETCVKIADNLVDIFTSRQADQVYIASTYYQSVLAHKPRIEKFLNLEQIKTESTQYLLEPDINGILKPLLLQYISLKFKLIILEAFTAEHSARTIAMKTATENAKDLLETLVVLRNKVRQANITQELLEIVSSSQALKG